MGSVRTLALVVGLATAALAALVAVHAGFQVTVAIAMALYLVVPPYLLRLCDRTWGSRRARLSRARACQSCQASGVAAIRVYYK